MTIYDPSKAPEADIVVGEHPAPGPRPSPREYWNGSATVDPRGTGSVKRIKGIDAARGFALLGIIFVHTMPMVTPTTQQTTLFYELFAGKSATLFGLLAGISLALITGGAIPHTGRRLTHDRVAIAVRAAILLIFGMALNFLPMEIFNILPYYAVFFLVGLLFTRMAVRGLLAWAALFALGGPFAIYAINWTAVFTPYANPNLVDLVDNPLNVLVTFLATGTYPALTWMAFITLGIALGRLNLGELSVQIRLCVGGALTAGIAIVSSEIIMHWFGVFRRLVAATPMSVAEIVGLLEIGGTVPAFSWWWLVTDGPHSNTPFSVVGSAGFAVLALGAFLIASRQFAEQLAPVSAAGAMTFTLYTAHMFVLAFADHERLPLTWTVIQICAAIVFAIAWRSAFGQGPLEKVISKSSKAAARVAVREKAAVEPTAPAGADLREPRREQRREGGAHRRD